MTFRMGEQVTFKPKKGKPMQAEVAFEAVGQTIEIIIGTDPFPVTVDVAQVSSCKSNGKVVSSDQKVRRDRTSKKEKGNMTATAEKVSGKQLRKQAQALGIEGWEEMGRVQLSKAIAKAERADDTDTTTSKPKTKKVKKGSKNKPKGSKPKAPAPPVEAEPEAPAPKAKKSAAKKAPAKKAAAKKAAAPKGKAEPSESDGLTFAKSHPKPTPEHGVNPFRKNSNLFRVARLLLKGGVRKTLAEKLSTEVDLHPYQKKVAEVDLLDYDKRLLLGAQTMRDTFGYGIQRVGRGIEGRILVFVPGGPNDPRNKKAAKKAPAKKAKK